MNENVLSTMLDARSYSVLEALSSLRGTSDDVYNGFFWPITISQHLRLSADIVRDEYDLLVNAGFIELKPRPGGERIAALARITPKGDADLASRRKIGDAAASAVYPVTPQPQQHYDIFLSHASDDNEYAIPLYEALSAQFSVFIDKTGLRAGASFPHDIGNTIASSDWGVFLLTPAFMNKGYTREELDTFLHREIETQRRQTVIVTRGTTFAHIEAYHALLAKRLQLNADQQPLSEIVREIAIVVRPPTVPLTPAAPPSGRTKLYVDGPEDALPEQRELLQFLPRVEFANTGVHHDGTCITLSFALESVGPGDCFNLAYFLPNLEQGRAHQRLSKNLPFRRTIRLDQTRAYGEHVKSYFKAVFEFEDVGGNLYRQYGDVHQTGDNVFSNYWVDNMSRPYLVAQRIIKS